MGRLEDIIEREHVRKQLTPRRVVIYVVFILTVVTIILVQCTNLGMPKPLPKPPKADHVDGVLLRSH